MSLRLFAVAGACAAVLATMPARADLLLPAVSNATVQPGGPRAAANGLRYFNVEGAANGQYASFGVLDFTLPSAATVSAQSLTLALTQANASFTANGGLDFYLTEDTATGIAAGASPLRYAASAAPSGIGSQLAPRFLLGSGMFTRVADGAKDNFTFALGGAAQSYLNAEMAMGGPIRLIVGAADPGVAATYAGYTNTAFAGPALTIATGTPPSAVPEPDAWLLVLTGLAGLAAARVLLARGSRLA